eukprot:gene1553-1691_t
MFPLTFLGLLALVATLAQAAKDTTTYPTPGPTYEASDYTKWEARHVGKSKRASVEIKFTGDDGSDDYITLTRLDLVGNSYDRGFAHGKLLYKEIMEFTGPQLDKFYAQEVLDLDLSQFPEPLQSVLRALQLKGAKAAPEIFHKAMAWVWEQEKQYVPSYLIDEINGIANGLCDAVGSVTACNVTQWVEAIQTVNMLPELIRMACTSYGAWGSATPNGGLIQLRALDFGAGPFANYTVVSVSRQTENGNAFVSVTYPGMVGVITGISQSGVGISEKVWMTYDTPDLQPGSYDGLADIFVLRDLLQNAKNRDEAATYVQNVKRTWAIWIGVGDYETQKFNLFGYKQDSVGIYDDVTMPSMTGQPYIENIAYVDKHPQPSHATDLPVALNDFHGNITCENTKVITKYHNTGDLHIASYDYTDKLLYLSIGKINHKGEYGPIGGDLDSWKAYNRPWLKFNLKDLWTGI